FAAMRSIAVAGAFFPDVLVTGERFRVVWRPARFVSEVGALLSAVERVATAPRTAAPRSVPRSSGSVPDARSTVEIMAAAFLTEALVAAGFTPPSKREADHPVSRALFSGKHVPCVAPGERALPAALDSWLSVYELMGRRLPLELRVEEARSSTDSRGFRLSASVASTEQGKGDRASRVSLHTVARLGTGAATDALAFVALLSNFVPALGLLGARPWAQLSMEELAAFVVEAAPLLQGFGVSIVLPRSLRKLLTPRPALVATKKASYTTYLDLKTAFSFDWAVAIGDDRVSAAEFAELVDAGLSLVRWRGAWVRIEPSEAARLLSRVSGRAELDAGEALRTALSGDVAVDGALAQAVEKLLGSGRRASDDAPLPASLHASLRTYQERGYRWMIGTWERGFGCLLADDMGLGKTVQTIAAVLYLKETGQLEAGALVCAPASLLSNWERELQKFAPSLSVCSYFGTGRRLSKADVTLSSYETWLRDQKKLESRDWSLSVLDEAHYIKNPQSRRALAVKAIRTTRRLALTGTPVENNLAELWSIFDFTLPGYLGTLPLFSREYRKPIELERSEDAAARLRAVTAPFIMRRLKTDATIVTDLPDKIIVNEYAGLTPEQAALYEAVASEGLAFIATAAPEERLGVVLGMITALKQVSNHPRNYDGESAGSSDRSG
ncbi:MAG: DEAD/DEAH box helicase family protein, partial [Spirochaetales bacterium]|nr:DEAD/DEAH box helicase family protein [Spirochaetales bacterium]